MLQLSIMENISKGQVLADNITIAANDGEEVDFDDFKLNIKIQKV